MAVSNTTTTPTMAKTASEPPFKFNPAVNAAVTTSMQADFSAEKVSIPTVMSYLSSIVGQLSNLQALTKKDFSGQTDPRMPATLSKTAADSWTAEYITGLAARNDNTISASKTQIISQITNLFMLTSGTNKTKSRSNIIQLLNSLVSPAGITSVNTFLAQMEST